MKKALYVLFIAAIALSCNNAKTDDTTAKEETPKPTTSTAETKMPYTATYSSQFTVADQKISESILTLFKQWDDNKLNDGRSLFADTVHLYAHGYEFHGPRDSFFVVSQNQRDRFKDVKTVVHAWVPLHSTDKNEDWALIWSTAYTTDMGGKVDSVSYQGTWRLNNKGQFDQIYDFQAKAPVPQKIN